MADWRTAVLARLGAPVTEQNLSFLAGWQRWEGGHTNNDARFNWLNTTKNAPGATKSINSVGVKAFDSFQNGVNATAATLTNGRYQDIVDALMSGNPYKAKPVGGLSTWLSGQPNSDAGRKYAEKVLGVKAPAGTLYGDPRQRAAQAFQQGPAGVVRGPSPNQRLAFTQQAVQGLLAMSQSFIAGRAPDPGITQGLMQARMELAAATNESTAAESEARAQGGTTMPSGVSFDGASGTARKVLEAAAAQVGKPYVWGAESPKEGGFDCSGLIDWSYRQAGIKLPGRLTTYTALKMGTSVKGSTYKPGDWIITNGGKHMVMYVGNGQVIAAPRTGERVQYQPLSRFDGQIVDVRRVLK